MTCIFFFNTNRPKQRHLRYWTIRKKNGYSRKTLQWYLTEWPITIKWVFLPLFYGRLSSSFVNFILQTVRQNNQYRFTPPCHFYSHWTNIIKKIRVLNLEQIFSFWSFAFLFQGRQRLSNLRVPYHRKNNKKNESVMWNQVTELTKRL